MNYSLNELGGNTLPPIEPAVTVSRLSIGSLATMFLVAVGLHVLIGVYLNKAKKDIEKFGETIELKERLKILNLLFRWYPAGAVVVLILTLYL